MSKRNDAGGQFVRETWEGRYKSTCDGISFWTWQNPKNRVRKALGESKATKDREPSPMGTQSSGSTKHSLETLGLAGY